MVPVLSNTTVLILKADSRLEAFFIRIPFEAPNPVPTIIAVGVANPNAQGQAITITAIKLSIAALNGTPIIKYQTRNVSIAIDITMGTNTEAILSDNFCIGAFDPWASSTYFIICAITVDRKSTRLNSSHLGI